MKPGYTDKVIKLGFEDHKNPLLLTASIAVRSGGNSEFATQCIAISRPTDAA